MNMLSRNSMLVRLLRHDDGNWFVVIKRRTSRQAHRIFIGTLEECSELLRNIQAEAY